MGWGRSVMNEFSIRNQVNDGLIEEMIKLDKLVFKDDDIGDFDKCKEWIKCNPDIYTILMLDNKVIGYINFMPITDVAYQSIKQGKLKDYELTKNEIMTYSSAKPLKCLFTSIVIHPEHQTGLELAKLWKGFFNKLKSLKLTISSVIMDCVTAIGEKCAKNYLGAKFITNSHNGKIYEGSIKGL